MSKSKLTQERLKELLDYDPETGVFRWKRANGKKQRGSIAGCVHLINGYRYISVDGRSYAASKLVWLYEYGHMGGKLKRINEDRADNRLSNLVDSSENKEKFAKLTPQILKDLLTYDPLTGLFTWRVRRAGQQASGQKAGYLDEKGYIRISVYGTEYKAHRLAWLYMTNAWPDEVVDHIDGNKSDNSWGNLRAASVAQNSRNAKTPKNNTSGIKGVHRSTCGGRWNAQIGFENRLIRLGSFPTKAEAADAYAQAAKRYHREFARVESY